MNDILFLLQGIFFLVAFVCFFWALKYRRDEGNSSPRMGIAPKKLIEFYGPKGAKIALIGTISFLISGVSGAIHYLSR
ncbi:MAG: hypothetical protein WBP42_07965 [Candidatus Zixiibacteriota bacterium]